jgi:hypothetical protein
VFLIAEVISDLTVHRGLDHPLGQLLQQAAFAGQLQARCADLLDQLGVHPLRVLAGVLFFATAEVSTASVMTVIRCVSLSGVAPFVPVSLLISPASSPCR